MQLADNAGPNQGLRCPLTESVDTVVYVDEQKMLRLDCIDAHADLDLLCPQINKGPFRALRIIRDLFCDVILCYSNLIHENRVS